MNWETERESTDDAAFRFICANCRTLLRENGGLCPVCFRSGLVFSRYRRVAEEYLPAIPGVTARDLAKSVARVFKVRSCSGLLLGPGAFVVSHGSPGHGKSTQLLKVADELLPSVFLPLEMGIGPLLASMLQRLEIHSDRITFQEPRNLPEIFVLAETRGLRALFIDSLSVSTVQPNDARSLARGNNIVVWGTLQETKNGTFRGSNEWAHAADVILSIENMRWTLTKSRYQPAGLSGEILQCDTATESPVSTV
jgi:predicted ATP-dependent serine protease